MIMENKNQCRQQKEKELKEIGAKTILEWEVMNDGTNRILTKTNEEVKSEIDSLINLPDDWTDEEYDKAFTLIKNFQIQLRENPNLLNNEITKGKNLNDSNFEYMNIRDEQYKAWEVVRKIKELLNNSELNKSDQTSVVVEVIRQLARELLNENKISQTCSNAVALSLICHEYDKPDWTWNFLARNIYNQNSKKYTDKLISELQKLELDE